MGRETALRPSGTGGFRGVAPRTLGFMVVPGPSDSPLQFGPPGQAPARRTAREPSRILPAHPFRAAVLILACTVVLYAVEFYDQLNGERLDAAGIAAREADGLARGTV